MDHVTIRSWVIVIGEHDSVTNENTLFEDYASAEKAMAFNLAITHNVHTSCDFNKRTDEAIVIDFASEDIY
jgi:hypothetical protein